MKHTCENCFKLHGYPNWWNDLQARKRLDAVNNDGGPGKATVATAEPHLSLTPPVETSQGDLSLTDLGKYGHALCTSHRDVNSNAWILDSGATDHMTFDVADFSHTSPPRCTSIANANGVISLS